MIHRYNIFDMRLVFPRSTVLSSQEMFTKVHINRGVQDSKQQADVDQPGQLWTVVTSKTSNRVGHVDLRLF